MNFRDKRPPSNLHPPPKYPKKQNLLQAQILLHHLPTQTRTLIPILQNLTPAQTPAQFPRARHPARLILIHLRVPIPATRKSIRARKPSVPTAPLPNQENPPLHLVVMVIARGPSRASQFDPRLHLAQGEPDLHRMNLLLVPDHPHTNQLDLEMP